jgi:hypothetical protein
VSVKITPPDCEVLVNGAPTTLHAGALALEGEPGDSFAVAVRYKGKKQERQVMIGKDGKPSIDAIDVAVDKKPIAGPAVTGKIVGQPTATAAAEPTAKPAPTATATQKPNAGPVGESTF